MLCTLLVTLCGSGPHEPEGATFDNSRVKRLNRDKHLYMPRAPNTEVTNVLQKIGLDLPTPSSEVPPARIAVATWSRRPAELSLATQLKYNQRYCTRHGYTCIRDRKRRLPNLRPHFEKLAMIEDLFVTGSHAVLLLDDDACVVRPEVPLQHFLDVFAGDSMILSSVGWQTFVPAPKGDAVLLRETWDVPKSPYNPPGFQPSPYTPNTGVVLFVNTTYTRTLLRLLLANNGSRLTMYNDNEACCFEQDALLGATMTTWQKHIGMVPARQWNCYARDLNTYGDCTNPFVLHLAGHTAKGDVERYLNLSRTLRQQNAAIRNTH